MPARYFARRGATSGARRSPRKSWARPDYNGLPLPAWLFTVAKRRAVDYWRKQLHEQSLDESVPEQVAPVAARDVMGLIGSCGSVNATHRACVVLRYMHGMTRAEIAARTGLDINQVKGYLQYALKLLRDEIKKGAGTSTHGKFRTYITGRLHA